jgi:restriction system protein
MYRGDIESIRLKDIAGAEIEKQGILHKDKLAILESKESITKHIYDVENASEWKDAILKSLGKK